jgi:hypothetical protein
LHVLDGLNAPGGSRTHNLGLRRASLCPLSYWGIVKNYNIRLQA